jgi:NADH-quinone oxidoreductase subunit E
MRTPSFDNLSVLSKIVKGHLVADLVAILASIDIVLGDIDAMSAKDAKKKNYLCAFSGKLNRHYAFKEVPDPPKYPPEGKRSAVMPLLYLAQREEGYVSKAAMQDIAGHARYHRDRGCGIVGFYTLYHEEKEGKYRMQVCADLPCALRGAEGFLKNLCDNLGIKVGETTEDGLVTIEAVMCLAACDKAPMFQTQGPEGIKYHENMTVELVEELMELIEALQPTT